MQNQFLIDNKNKLQLDWADLEKGEYIAFDDGEIDGTYLDAESIARASARDGIGCTIISVYKRYDATSCQKDEIVEPLDFDNMIDPKSMLFHDDYCHCALMHDLGAARGIDGGWFFASH